jgi:hypothetical protein
LEILPPAPACGPWSIPWADMSMELWMPGTAAVDQANSAGCRLVPHCKRFNYVAQTLQEVQLCCTKCSDNLKQANCVLTSFSSATACSVLTCHYTYLVLAASTTTHKAAAASSSAGQQ